MAYVSNKHDKVCKVSELPMTLLVADTPVFRVFYGLVLSITVPNGPSPYRLLITDFTSNSQVLFPTFASDELKAQHQPGSILQVDVYTNRMTEIRKLYESAVGDTLLPPTFSPLETFDVVNKLCIVRFTTRMKVFKNSLEGRAQKAELITATSPDWNFQTQLRDLALKIATSRVYERVGQRWNRVVPESIQKEINSRIESSRSQNGAVGNMSNNSSGYDLGNEGHMNGSSVGDTSNVDMNATQQGSWSESTSQSNPSQPHANDRPPRSFDPKVISDSLTQERLEGGIVPHDTFKEYLLGDDSEDEEESRPSNSTYQSANHDDFITYNENNNSTLLETGITRLYNVRDLANQNRHNSGKVYHVKGLIIGTSPDDLSHLCAKEYIDNTEYLMIGDPKLRSLQILLADLEAISEPFIGQDRILKIQISPKQIHELFDSPTEMLYISDKIPKFFGRIIGRAVTMPIYQHPISIDSHQPPIHVWGCKNINSLNNTKLVKLLNNTIPP